MSSFNLMLKNYFNDDLLQKLSRVKVLIIGCGGLGSHIAWMLIRCGFQNLKIVDFDRVELKNLNRQGYFFTQVGLPKVLALKDILTQINPGANIAIAVEKIDGKNVEKIIMSYDVIVEAVDDETTKALIFEAAMKLNKKVVAASGVAGFGDCERIKIKRGRNFVIVGDFATSVKDKKPYAPKVTAVAAIQADEVLRMVVEDE
ncbi:sulfur carrier protein ThiS adenylyltransferase ThiF [Carboxydothermus hydrogenoformans]|uniref:Molybdopterin biosynthesis protein MoeB n=1 Tax=Carboxydothermus hydrogenoformans (strain ATCC BAA-161 / DSM 6008 / Z-2901) TaxID=246194 RepID=Q3ACN6_CARHZ|nr:sulfur carrier protein ThiS adenylyltransferase ThiF [Carboxydothermus hydrogenoformans]ABB14278.1 molybdopterin biosynthesis protein MoeB [Carboxydothermus hydrogenoformans Z-2901]